MIKRVVNSQLFRTASVYTSGNFVNSAIPFLLVPILTRYLTPRDYGIVAMFWVLTPIAAAFTGLSVDTAIGRQYFERTTDDLPRYIANCLYILVTSTAVVGLLFFLLSGPISTYSGIPSGWLWAVLVISSCQYIYQIRLTLWRAAGKPLPFSLFQIGHTSLNLGLSIALVVFLGMKWQGRIVAQVVTFVVFAAANFAILWREKWLSWKVDTAYIRDALKFGIPLIPQAISFLIISMTDRVLITNLIGISVTGVYTVGVQIGMVIGLLQSSFNLAWMPWLFERLGKDDYYLKRRIVKITYLYMVAVTLCAVMLALLAPWFLDFFVGKDFTGAYRYVFWIALGMAFNGMYSMFANYILYAQKTYILAVITLFVAVINIFISYLLVTRNGAVGAAQGAMIAYFLCFALTWFISAKVHKMPWGLRSTRSR